MLSPSNVSLYSIFLFVKPCHCLHLKFVIFAMLSLMLEHLLCHSIPVLTIYAYNQISSNTFSTYAYLILVLVGVYMFY